MRRGLRSATGAIGERRSIVVAVTAGDVTGWGEAAPVTGHSLDTADEAWTLLEALAELVIAGDDPAPIEGSTATSALDAALTDLAARLDGSPPAIHLGGAMEPVPGSVAIDLPHSERALLDGVDRGSIGRLPPRQGGRSTPPRWVTSPPPDSGIPASASP